MAEHVMSQHDLVLNAIDVISYRKNRPNIARIYRHLVRFSNISSATCEKVLDELVEQGRVIKVTYKGNISYRNASKWKHVNSKKSDSEKKNASQKRSSSILAGTIAELVVRVPAYFRTGVPCDILEQHLLCKDGRFTKESIHKLLQKELQQETLVQLDNGNYFLAFDSASNSTASEDSDSNIIQDMDDNDNPNLMEEDDLIEEINDDDPEMDEEDNDDDVDAEDCDEYELEDEEYEDVDKAVDENKTSEARPIDLSGESDEEAVINDSFKQEDEEYLPPHSVRISTRRHSSGRISVRNKKTRYDASEYFFPSLKRTYKARQEKGVIGKQPQKKHSKILTSKEFKKALLNPIPDFYGSTCSNVPSKTTTAATSLQKSRLPNVPLKAVQFTSIPLRNFICTICNEDGNEAVNGNTIQCVLCQRKAHLDCVETDSLQIDSSTWTCENCASIIAQSCCMCHQMISKTENASSVFCDSCKLSYHKSCHVPPIVNEECLTGSWRCNSCTEQSKSHPPPEKPEEKGVPNSFDIPKAEPTSSSVHNEDAKSTEGKFEDIRVDESKDKINIPSDNSFSHLREKQVSLIQINDSSATRPRQMLKQLLISSQSVTSSPTSSPPSSQITTDDTTVKEEEESDEGQPPTKIIKQEKSADIPDSSKWTSTEVYTYFKDLFGDQVASAFLKQEIDGNSLKLLRRSDVLRGLGFKLGIGLNVLYHVKMLQFRTSDLKIIWAAE